MTSLVSVSQIFLTLWADFFLNFGWLIFYLIALSLFFYHRELFLIKAISDDYVRIISNAEFIFFNIVLSLKSDRWRYFPFIWDILIALYHASRLKCSQVCLKKSANILLVIDPSKSAQNVFLIVVISVFIKVEATNQMLIKFDSCHHFGQLWDTFVYFEKIASFILIRTLYLLMIIPTSMQNRYFIREIILK